MSGGIHFSKNHVYLALNIQVDLAMSSDVGLSKFPYSPRNFGLYINVGINGFKVAPGPYAHMHPHIFSILLELEKL